MALLNIVKPALEGLHKKAEIVQGGHLPRNKVSKTQGTSVAKHHLVGHLATWSLSNQTRRPLAIKINVLGVILVCAN